jgi:hypothetical protein
MSASSRTPFTPTAAVGPDYDVEHARDRGNYQVCLADFQDESHG